MKLKKGLTFVLMAALVVLLAACSQHGGKSAASSNSGKNATAGTASSNSSNASNSKSSSSNSSSGTSAPVTVNLFTGVGSNLGNLDTNWFTKYVEKKFNMKIKWDEVASSDIQTKEPVLLASGNYPDIIWSGTFTNAQLMKYGQQGLFVPLNDLLKKYAPNVWNQIQSTPDLKQGVFAPDGNIYGLPQYNYCLHCDFAANDWVYKPLLDKYHLTIPKTTADFEHMLEVFNQHGIIPLTGSKNGWHSSPVTFLMNAFIYDDGSNYFNIDNGKIAFAPVQTEWKQGLQYLHELHSKGLISSAAFTQTNDVLNKQAINHKVGVVPWGCINCVLGPNAASDLVNWEAVPPLTGPQGVHYTGFYGNGVSGAVFAITNKAKLQEEIPVLKLLNFMWTPLGNTMFNFGPEGKYWTKAKPGQKGLMGTQALFNIDWNQPQPFTYDWGGMGPEDQSKTWRNGYVVPPPFSKDGSGSEAFLQYYTEKDYVGNQPKEVVPASIWVKPADAQKYALLTTNINDYVKQWMVGFIDGNKSITKDWNGYVSGLNKLGLEQYLSMTQSAMGKPFDTSSFTKDTADIKYLESLK